MGTPDERILKRIKKLLDMAEDAANANEAMVAARQARALMDKHQISKDDLLLVSDETFGITHGEVVTARTATWIGCIAAAVGQLNDCQPIKVQRAGEVHYGFRGFKTDAVLAKYLHDYLVAACVRMLEASGIKGRSAKDYYRLGFSAEIAGKINTIIQARETIIAGDGRSLVVAKKDMVAAHFDDGTKKARTPHVRPPTEEEAAAAQRGMVDAAAVPINQQLETE